MDSESSAMTFRNFNRDREITFEFNTDCVNTDLFNTLCGDSENNESKAELCLCFSTMVQNRKHKKKRINKKWAKRYGFREVQTKIVGNMKTTSNDGNICEFAIEAPRITIGE